MTTVKQVIVLTSGTFSFVPSRMNVVIAPPWPMVWGYKSLILKIGSSIIFYCEFIPIHQHLVCKLQFLLLPFSLLTKAAILLCIVSLATGLRRLWSIVCPFRFVPLVIVSFVLLPFIAADYHFGIFNLSSYHTRGQHANEYIINDTTQTCHRHH